MAQVKKRLERKEDASGIKTLDCGIGKKISFKELQ